MPYTVDSFLLQDIVSGTDSDSIEEPKAMESEPIQLSTFPSRASLRVKRIATSLGMFIDLKHYTNLKTVDLSCDDIGIGGAKVLADRLRHCTNLKILDLAHNKIGAAGAKALADAMVHCRILHTLDLAHNDIGAAGAKSLADSMVHCHRMQSLDLAHNEIGAAGAKSLADSMVHCHDLQILDLAHNKIGAAGAKSLADAMVHCCILQTLDLAHNEIGAAGAKALADAMVHCYDLQTLNLAHNEIGAAGAKALADVMVHCYLQTLNLAHNEIGGAGAKALADAMVHCRYLQTLNLAHNKIGAAGVKVFADYLVSQWRYQYWQLHGEVTLDLGHNDINAADAKALAHLTCDVASATLSEHGIIWHATSRQSMQTSDDKDQLKHTHLVSRIPMSLKDKDLGSKVAQILMMSPKEEYHMHLESQLAQISMSPKEEHLGSQLAQISMSPKEEYHMLMESKTTDLTADIKKQPYNLHNRFLKRHVLALTKILASESTKWRHISSSLNLPKTMMMYSDDSLICLKKVLCQWIVEQHEHAKAPTVENLKIALESEAVGLAAMANQLERHFTEHGILFD